MKKVFLDELPRWENGNCKGRINWKESIGHKVKFIYDDIEGEIDIVDYEIKKHMLHIKYQDKTPFKITTVNLQKCQLGKLLGKITSEFKIEIGTHLKDDKRDLTITDREYREFTHKPDKKGRIYIQKQKWYKYKCKCGYNEGWMDENSLLTQGTGCSVCCRNPRVVIEGVNSIFDTALWMVKYFVNTDEAKLYTKSNSQKIKVKCPDCGKIKEITINNLYNRKSMGCSCGDGVSYPEKIMFSVLEQLELNFKTQLNKTTFKWCDKYIYDFYFKYDNKQYIIEIHGIQHYEQTSRKGVRTLKVEQENDKLKKELALSNGIKEENYIAIDCRYSELEFIKQNILNGRLNELFDLSNINWNKCEDFALSNRVKEACKLKRDNPNMTTAEIGEVMNLSRHTVKIYLKKGSKLGWCEYDAKEESFKGRRKAGKASGKQVEIFKDGKSLGMFDNCNELERQSEELFGVKLLNSCISVVCLGKQKQHKGFTFQYITQKEYQKYLSKKKSCLK